MTAGILLHQMPRAISFTCVVRSPGYSWLPRYGSIMAESDHRLSEALIGVDPRSAQMAERSSWWQSMIRALSPISGIPIAVDGKDRSCCPAKLRDLRR
jgi:hypothetical protein